MTRAFTIKKPNIHYAWLILIACCALQAGSQGTIFDTLGVFNSPVCNDLGFEFGSFAFAQTFSAVAMMVTQPFSTYLYHRFGIKHVLLVSGCIYYTAYFSLSMASQLWHWYLLLSIEGIMGGFFYRTSYTILLCRWFASKTALALGIATAVGSIMGMIMNPVATMVIAHFGWRSCYQLLASLGALITIPLISLIVHASPAEMDLAPYHEGCDTTDTIHFPAKHHGKKAIGICILFILSSVFSYLCGGYYSHLPNYSISIGMGAIAGSLMTSFELGGTMIMKFLVGPISDRIGLMKTETLIMILSLIGYFCYFFLTGNILFFTTALCGIYCATNMVLMPLLAREELGEDRFQTVLPWITTAGAAASSISNTIYGFIFDIFGNYDLMFILCMIGIIASYLILIIIKRLGKQK